MSSLGILLVCDHYPRVAPDADQIDAQLRRWLASFGTRFETVEVFAAYDRELPRHGAGCDAWIASGAELDQTDASGDSAFRLQQFLRAAVALGRTIYAVNHGEHVLHGAVSCINAPRPETARCPRSIRNPFRSFLWSDTLHRFNPRTRSVEALERPSDIHARGALAPFVAPLVEGIR